MQARKISGAGAWRRGVTALALAGMALAALPQAPVAAQRRGGGFFGRSGFSHSGFSHSGFSHSGFSSSHFGIGFGNRGFGFSFGYNSFHGYRPYRSYVGYPYAIYPPLYGGVYAYGSPYLSIFDPFYSYAYSAPEPRTVVIYPPPVVRTYPEDPPATVEPPRSTHPYDEPVSSSPEKGSVDEALADIRAAWEKSDVALLERHLPASEVIAIYRDGTLRQELKPDEFLRLNRDAFGEIRTLRFRFTEVRRPAADEAKATAIHTYVVKDGDGKTETATLHYDLLRRDDVWTLRAVHVVPGG